MVITRASFIGQTCARSANTCPSLQEFVVIRAGQAEKLSRMTLPSTSLHRATKAQRARRPVFRMISVACFTTSSSRSVPGEAKDG